MQIEKQSLHEVKYKGRNICIPTYYGITYSNFILVLNPEVYLGKIGRIEMEHMLYNLLNAWVCTSNR